MTDNATFSRRIVGVTFERIGFERPDAPAIQYLAEATDRQAPHSGLACEAVRQDRLCPLLTTLLLAAALAFAVELIARGSLARRSTFFADIHRPGWTTVLLFALAAFAIDALLGRAAWAGCSSWRRWS